MTMESYQRKQLKLTNLGGPAKTAAQHLTVRPRP